MSCYKHLWRLSNGSVLQPHGKRSRAGLNEAKMCSRFIDIAHTPCGANYIIFIDSARSICMQCLCSALLLLLLLLLYFLPMLLNTFRCRCWLHTFVTIAQQARVLNIISASPSLFLCLYLPLPPVDWLCGRACAGYVATTVWPEPKLRLQRHLPYPIAFHCVASLSLSMCLCVCVCFWPG